MEAKRSSSLWGASLIAAALLTLTSCSPQVGSGTDNEVDSSQNADPLTVSLSKDISDANMRIGREVTIASSTAASGCSYVWSVDGTQIDLTTSRIVFNPLLAGKTYTVKVTASSGTSSGSAELSCAVPADGYDSETSGYLSRFLGTWKLDYTIIYSHSETIAAKDFVQINSSTLHGWILRCEEPDAGYYSVICGYNHSAALTSPYELSITYSDSDSSGQELNFYFVDDNTIRGILYIVDSEGTLGTNGYSFTGSKQKAFSYRCEAAS